MTNERVAAQLKRLAELRGPAPKELLERVKAQSRVHKLILGALGSGPKTVPELAAACGLEAGAVFWHVNALRKYGKVADVPGKGSYPKYELRKQEAAG